MAAGVAWRCIQEMETTMKPLKQLGAVALLTAALPLFTSTSSLADPGPGPCTPPGVALT